MAPDMENFRALHAVRVLKDASAIDLDKLIELAYDPYLPGFEAMVPPLIRAYDRNRASYPQLAEAIDVLRTWDFRTSKESVAMSLAHFYGIEFARKFGQPERMIPFNQQVLGRDPLNLTDAGLLTAFDSAVTQLNEDFGTWNTPWGEINRFQRLSGDIDLQFDDEQESIAVGMASGRWGALGSFGANARPNTKRIYGSSGNSFVAVVEFGERLRAKSILAGGQNSNPNSPHFYDQAQRYADVNFKDVAYYREDVEARAKETYNPGKRTN
jgi:acyl-homoserine lactone acylase PvdQ